MKYRITKQKMKKKYYPDVDQNLNFPTIEEQILEFWNKNKIFEKSIDIRNNADEFVFYDGPPFASGLPHHGHMLAGYIKDSFARYQTMNGKKVERMFGWDCHGLPAEMGVEKESGISGRKAIEDYGIDKFNGLCKNYVLKYVNEWKHYVNRSGRWVDFDNGYKTMNLNYMESVIWVFKQLYDKGLLYEDFRVMPYSWTCQTPLSNFETKQDNSYREKADKAITIKFKLSDNAKLFENIKNFVSSLSNKNSTLFPPVKGGKGGLKTSQNLQNLNIKKDSLISNIENDKFDKNKVETPLTPLDRGELSGALDMREPRGELDMREPRGELDMGKEESSLNKIIEAIKDKAIYILAWTTTPWTLPSNLALTVSKDIDYVLFKKDEDYYIIGKPLMSKYKKEFTIDDKGNFDIVAEFRGSELLGLHYEPLLPYLKDLKEVKECDKCFTILHGDFVTTTDGTGIVHTAPGFGEDDNVVCKTVGIPTICPVDDAGKFISPIDEFAGTQVFETNEPIIIKLKNEGKWVKTEQYLHNYPHCWRTDAPLIYRALPSWYVKVEAIKDKMIANNQQINWIPSHLKDGRFGKWLEGARDWSITRNRFWGCPVPVWKSDNPKYPRIDVYGSIAELEKDFGVKVEDLHRPFIDTLKRKNPDDPTGKSMMIRVTDVLDCWFESGSMPYAQHHYPFENKEWFEKHFPADFITEGDGQLRGWFYLLLVLSTALFDKPCFKNVISYGIAVDETGKKLSKRLRNYVDPLDGFNMFGSDSLRWVMMKSPALKGEEIRLDKDGKDVKETLRMVIKPIMNSYNFFCMYANSDGIKAEKITQSTNSMDIYILSKMKQTIENIKQSMDDYTPAIACKEVEDFFEVLNNWYIRRNKNRFWKSERDNDKTEAYNTLYTVLVNMMKAIAPLLPFTTEYIWRGLNN